MRSEIVPTVLKVYRSVVRKSAIEEYVVRSRPLEKNGGKYRTTSYTVVFLDHGKRLNGRKVLTATCTCPWAKMGPEGRKPCRHVKAVLKMRMPTVSIWLTETDAQRQHRRVWPFQFRCDPLVSRNGVHEGGLFFVTERRPGRERIRAEIR